jgi:hypothetical protein
MIHSGVNNLLSGWQELWMCPSVFVIHHSGLEVGSYAWVRVCRMKYYGGSTE